MNRKKLVVVVVAAAVFIAHTRAARAAETFRFAVIGDSRPISAVLPQSPPFKEMLREIDLIGVDFAVHVGDLVFGYMSETGELTRQYDDLTATMKNVRTPFYFAIGNHEVGAKGGEEQYVEKVGKLFYSFDKGASHFVIIDSDCCGGGDTGALGAEQLEWLEKDLAAARGAKNVFVFMHKPMFYEPVGGGTSWSDVAARDEAHRLFKEAGNVRAVFAGDAHIYKNVNRDGISYYISGGGGAETYNPESGGFYHFLLVTVKGKKINVRVVEPYHLWYECDPACDGRNGEVTLTLVNTLYSNMPLRLSGLMIDMPQLSTGRKYRISGGRITARRDNGDGTDTLRISALMNSVLGFHNVRLWAE